MKKQKLVTIYRKNKIEIKFILGLYSFFATASPKKAKKITSAIILKIIVLGTIKEKNNSHQQSKE